MKRKPNTLKFWVDRLPHWEVVDGRYFITMHLKGAMPNHLHLFCEFGGKGMKPVLEDFKRWTGHQATKLLKDPPQRFWQREWFDHWSRSDEEDNRIVNYVRKNPVKAKLVSDYRDWKYGGWNCENPRG